MPLIVVVMSMRGRSAGQRFAPAKRLTAVGVRSLVVLACVVLTSCGHAGVESTAQPGSRISPGAVRHSAQAAPTCTADDLTLSALSISAMTGEHGLILVFHDHTHG